MDTVGEDLDYTIPPLVAACLAAARRTRRGAPITALDAGCGAGKWLRLLDADARQAFFDLDGRCPRTTARVFV